MGVLKKLASETALYGVSTILGRLFNYVLVPLHTSLFRPAQLAPQAELYTYTAVAFVIYMMGLETGFFRFANKSEADKRTYYNLILSFIIMVSGLLSGLLLLFSGPLARAMDYRGDQILFVWMAIIMATDAIVAIPFARLRLEKKAKQFIAAKLWNVGLNVAFNVLFLFVFRDIYYGRYLTFLKPLVDSVYSPETAPQLIVMANLIANLTFFWFLRRELADFRFTVNWAAFGEVWRYSYPILLMNLAAVTNMMADRLFLRYLLPDGFYPGRTYRDAFGIYANCYKLSIFMNLVIQAFKYSAEPFFFSQTDNKNAPETFALIMKWFVVVCVLLWVGVSLNLDLFGFLFLRQPIYREGLVVVPFLLLAFLFLGIYYNLTAWFKLTDKTKYGTLITILGAVSTVILNVLLVPRMGYLGSAITFAGSSFLMMAVCYWLGQKYFPVPYDLRSAAIYVLSAGLLIYLAYPIRISNLWVSVPYHAALFLLYAGVVLTLEWRHIPLHIRKMMKFYW